MFLDEGERFDEPADRFAATPVSHALALADREGVPWVILTRARQIRLYAARADTGVGRKGRAETFVEVDLALLPEDRAGYVDLLFSAGALRENGTLEEILRQSADFAAELAIRLRERVYFEAVPGLTTAVAARLDRDGELTEADLAHAYEQTLIVLFRLLFLAYAEDKDLLPYRTNSRYADHALKTIARRLAEDRTNNKVAFDPRAIDLWEDVRQLWRAVDKGNSGWGVPGYNGGLFSDIPDVNPAGAALAKVELTDAEFGPSLMALLVDVGPDGVIGPVDFRSLSVREFGTIYEGLLESMLSVAPTDLTVDAKGNYVPTKKAVDVVVSEGDVYFHNRSGARKATGSYFTKPFAVEHLLDHALEPALADHVARLQALLDEDDEVAAVEAFFDFRCVDLAMGSGHFLVAAVDRIEARLSGFLALHPIAPVTAELERLRRAAVDALGDLADGHEIETTSLLRRQVARRCIYGVDLNHISVELARLAIWIHTFVPGLPLSFLDHSLVCGNSLTGIGTIDEAIGMLDPAAEKSGALSLFREQIDDFLGRAGDALRRLVRVTEATGADIEAARSAHRDALLAVEPARDLFDLLVAARLGEGSVPVTADEERIRADKDLPRARAAAQQLQSLHFPVRFPEAFLRDRAGFDCIIGNPPWDKVLFESQAFWVTRAPGLNALGATQRERGIEQLRSERPDDAALETREQQDRELLQTLIEAGFPNRGRGHYDFAKLFVERACGLLNAHATLGYVLPASSLLLGGWGKLRELLLHRSDLTAVQARNKSGWLFEDVEHRTAVVLVTKHITGATDPSVTLWPGVASVQQLKSQSVQSALVLPRSVLSSLSDSVVVPWLNDPGESDVFETMRSRPSLAGGHGWITGVHDARWDFRGSGPHNPFASREESPGAWRVLMTRHVVPFGIDEGPAIQQFVGDPSQLGHGVEARCDGAVLGAAHPLIVFRHPSRNDDSRTMIATALPEEGYVHNKGYVHAVRHASGTTTDALLALLGYLNTFTCDWWVRRFVDRHITAPVANNLRLPDWGSAETAEAAALAAALLASHGAQRLAGGITVTAVGSGSDTDRIVRLEVLAARGFGLDRDDVALILDDFSDRPAACPPGPRAAILKEMA